jgi:hypothetical protein
MSNRNGSPWSASQALSWIICQKPRKLEGREWTTDMGPKLAEAQRKLAEAISAGDIQAWGRSQPHGLLEQVPRDPFCIPGRPVIVTEHGELRELLPHRYHYDGPRWHSIEFDADQIKGKFPVPAPPTVQDWMLKNATKEKKRDSLVRDCMDETGCTKREAEAAYKELPDTQRRRQGKPPRKSERLPPTTLCAGNAAATVASGAGAGGRGSARAVAVAMPEIGDATAEPSVTANAAANGEEP